MLIKNIQLYTEDHILISGSIIIKDGIIEHIYTEPVDIDDELIIDAKGQIAEYLKI